MFILIQGFINLKCNCQSGENHQTNYMPFHIRAAQAIPEVYSHGYSITLLQRETERFSEILADKKPCQCCATRPSTLNSLREVCLPLCLQSNRIKDCAGLNPLPLALINLQCIVTDHGIDFLPWISNIMYLQTLRHGIKQNSTLVCSLVHC